jgi:hypothetical protein
MPGSMPLRRLTIADLEIEDEPSFSHVALYADLKKVVADAKLAFLVPERGELSWERATLFNLTYWTPGVADVLASPVVFADVIAHVGWHHLADKHLKPSVTAHVLGESIASAFDVYLVGRLLGRSPDAAFLESQVPRMAEVWESAGAKPEAFERLLEEVAEQPERAFEDLRELLFDATIALSRAKGAEEADLVLARTAGHRFAPLLHHFELSTWVLRSKLEAAERGILRRGRAGERASRNLSEAPENPAHDSTPDGVENEDDGADARAIDEALREAPDAVRWLEERWVVGAQSFSIQPLTGLK